MTQERAANEADAGRSIEVALDAALLVMRNGGSTTSAERSFSSILEGVRVKGVSTIWRLDFIAATYERSSVVRAVGPIGVNLARVAGVADLSARATVDKMTADATHAALERVGDCPSPYNRWVAALAAAVAGASFSQLLGGDWGSLGIALVAAGAGQFARAVVQGKNLAAAPVMLTSALVSALIACAGLRFGLSAMEPATLIASVIYLVPGLPLINGFIDLVSHRHLLVGLERIANAAYLFLVLAIAIAVARTVLL